MADKTNIRRRARERALQFLFEVDVAAPRWEEAMPVFWDLHPSRPPVREYAEQLIEGSLTHMAEIDRRIAETVEHWSLERVAPVERNVLRIAVYELMWRGDIPSKVVINEAIDVAKKFADERAGKFVNGVLDKIMRVVRNDGE